MAATTQERKADILEEDCDGCAPLDGHRAGDEARCHDCYRHIFWDDEAVDYRHVEDPQEGCFLIAPDYEV